MVKNTHNNDSLIIKHNRYWYENITQQNGNQKEAKNCIQRRFETIDEREVIFYQNKIEKDRPSFGKVREALILYYACCFAKNSSKLLKN